MKQAGMAEVLWAQRTAQRQGALRRGLKLHPLTGAVAVALMLVGCASTPQGATSGAASSNAPTAKPPAPSGNGGAAAAGSGVAGPKVAAVMPTQGAASAPGNGAAARPAPMPPQPPFAKVVEDARRIEGLLTVWQKDDKFWIELGEKDFDQPLFLSPKLVSGIGEGGVFGGLMAGRFGASYGGAQWVEFHRVHNQVQLLARNAEFVAQAGTPAARAVARAFSPSLLGSAAVASQPHPERKTVLIEANALFLTDLLGIGPHLQRTYRQGYGLDVRNSAVLRARGLRDELVFETQNHYATASIAVAQPGTAPGAAPSVPGALADARSLFVQLQYSLTRLPEKAMRPRPADPRIGHFLTGVQDYTDDLSRSPRRRFVNRWRLDKKDPTAELSDPVKPITYWIDHSVPLAYRGAIRAGILEWNKAFERIGFRNAIVVQEQPDDADYDTLDTGRASVRWMTNAQAQFGAVGPSHVDPRSGEILDADIALESLSSRSMRQLRAQILASPSVESGGSLGTVESADHRRHDGTCEHADLAAEQLDYALDVAQIRDGLDPASPEAQAFVLAYLKEVTMHEVGHTLGLRHNFRASRAYTDRELEDPRREVLTGSVMEYAPVNLARQGQATPRPFQSTIGPYDYWAIEYAYKPLVPEQEVDELARIAARSGERELAFGTDEDHLLGLDPEVMQGDLGDDPVAFAVKRFDIASELLQRLESGALTPTTDTYPRLRRAVAYALRDVGRGASVLVRQIGGVRTLRDAPGTGRDPLQPLPAAQQRQALDVLMQRVFSPRGFTVSPALQRRLAPDFLDRGDSFFGHGEAGLSTDFVPDNLLIDLQRTLLNQLMGDAVAQRLLDSAAKSTSAGERSLTLSELHERLTQAVWGEAGAGTSPALAAMRRELQREHVQRLSAALLRPTAAGRAESRRVLRGQAEALLTRLQRGSAGASASAEARAHLEDCRRILRDSMNAAWVRTSG